MARSHPVPLPAGARPVILGAGHTGLLLALALDQVGLAPVVVERASAAEILDASLDGRALALMRGSKEQLERFGIWPALAPIATPIMRAEVADRGSGAAIAYDAAELDGQPFSYGIETRSLRAALLRLAQNRPGIALHLAAPLARIARQPARIMLHLASGAPLATPLLIGADGRESAVRAFAHIPAQRRPYGQAALTFALRLRRPQHGMVREFLRPAGPLALLPIGARLCSVTWIERGGVAEALLAGGPARLQSRLAAELAGAVEIEAILGRPAAYPLVGHLARRLVAPRIALIGDAAHGLHPIHAQGWNLTVRDVAALAAVLAEAAAAGLDLGGGEALMRYERARATDARLTFDLTDELNRLFSTDLAPARLLRGAGLTLLDRLAPLKRLAMRQGLGLGIGPGQPPAPG
jgi:2-octaprenyl-6-methoxyphenol hydroxylase